MKFRELGISPDVLEALDKIGFEEATPIQSDAIPIARTGVDLIGQAQTGTGKTFSFGIPMIEKLLHKKQRFAGLIICPTRELAVQVNDELNKIISNLKGIETAVIYGGQDYGVQMRKLKRGPQIIIGTPGRIRDHINRGTLDFSNLEMVILDEADEMLKMGFEEEVREILDGTPSTRQTLLFSATMPENIRKIANQYLNNPEHIKIQSKELTVDRIKQVYYDVNEESKFNLLIRLLDFYSFRSSIIFCNTKSGVDELASKLEKYSYRSDGLHGDLSQHQRDRVMNNFRNRNLDILVATDVAARGIDVKEIDVVFNYDLPQEEEFYVHRIGRTGRAGREGVSISFVNGKQRGRLKNIERYAKTTIEKAAIPRPEEVHYARVLNMFDTITNNINFDKNQDLYHTLSAAGYSDAQIINGLINTLAKDEREYPEIETPMAKKFNDEGNGRTRSRGRDRDRDRDGGRDRDRDRGSRDRKPESRRKGSSGILQINLGKHDKLRPQILLSFIKQKTRLHAADVGDIKIKNGTTVFEVNNDLEGFEKTLRQLNYKGKKIEVSRKSDME